MVTLLPATQMDEKIGEGKQLLRSISFKDVSTRRDLNAPADSLIFPVPEVAPLSSSEVAPVNRQDLVKYCAVILPLVVDIYQSTVNSSARIKCLMALTRGLYWLGADELMTVLPNVPLASFLARVLGRCLPSSDSTSAHSTSSSTRHSNDQVQVPAQNLMGPPLPPAPLSATHEAKPRSAVPNTTIMTFLSYALYLCDLVMSKLATQYHVFFRREGTTLCQ
jgi:hypothetical protein